MTSMTCALVCAARFRIGPKRDLLTARAEQLLRDVFRALRYATDLMGELMIGFRQREPGKSNRLAFSKGTRGTLFHPDMRTSNFADFQSGDVIIVRGTHP